MIRKINSIPVLYYHSVADHDNSRATDYLSCPVNIFKAQMLWLQKRGYYTCDWKELYQHMTGIRCLPEKTVHIQFDDGFLDNWSVVFPIMKEMEFKYTVLLTTDFIDRFSNTRPFVEKTNEKNIKDWWGYLNAAEIKKMAESGIVEFQAHGYTHTWYECDDEIVDVFCGETKYRFLFWNKYPEEKPFWLTDNWQERIPKGIPVFKYEKSLNNTSRFFPNPKFVEECKELSQKTNNLVSLKTVKDLAEKFRNKNELGSFETGDEYSTRISHELEDNKIELEQIVGKPIDFLVWPGGGNNDRVQEVAFNAGYKMLSKGSKLNEFDCGRNKIFRVAGFIPFPILNKEINIIVLRLQILRSQGNWFIRNIIEAVRTIRMLIK